MNLPSAGNGFAAVVFNTPESEAMRASIRSWAGEGRPRRHCVFTGTRTVLEHAVDRAVEACDRVLVMAVAGEEARLVPLEARPRTQVLRQPADRGSAVAALAAAAHVLVASPQAIVALLPAEHFIYPEGRFLDYLRYARFLVEHFDDRPVLLGAVPQGPDPGCAWIAPGPRLGAGPHALRRPQRILALHDGVGRHRAEILLRGGALWSTSTLVVRAQTLWNLGWWALPAQMERLETLRQVLAAVRDGRAGQDLAAMALAHAYRAMPAADFRRDLLVRAADSALVLAMEGLAWSEWNGPEQVQQSLDALGRQSGFGLMGAGSMAAAAKAAAWSRGAAGGRHLGPSAP